jgi:hypothetical protein
MGRLFFILSLFAFANAYSDHIVWSGLVLSDGTPTAPVKLELHKEYFIKASGFVNLGKWVQGGEKLANDACFEFNKEKNTAKVESLKNSNDISVCDGDYNPNHIYQSAVFTAKQDRIHFWVHDTTYEDNSGSFKVEIFLKAK